MKPVPDYTPEIAFRFNPFAALGEASPSARHGISAVFYPLDPFKIDSDASCVITFSKRQSVLAQDYYLVDVYDEGGQRVAQLDQWSPSPLATTWESKFFDAMWWFPQQAEAHAEHVADPDPDYECKLDPVSLKWATDNYDLLTALATLGESHQEGIRGLGTIRGVSRSSLDVIERVSFQDIQNAFVWDIERINIPHTIANQLRR